MIVGKEYETNVNKDGVNWFWNCFEKIHLISNYFEKSFLLENWKQLIVESILIKIAHRKVIL